MSIQKQIIKTVLTLTIVFLGVYFFTLENNKEEKVEQITTVGLKQYNNSSNNFSLLYPENLEIDEYIEAKNVSTIVFQNPQEGKGFQLFVLPYTETQISEERFVKDIPSGIRKDLKNITLDGAIGASFYSEDTFLGETYEIWFIHEGFLYQATTLRSLDLWLDGIIQTISFN